MTRWLRYLAEGLLLHILFFVFKCMPVDMASNIGGKIGRFIGPKLAASRKAYRNIERAMPALSHQEQDVIVDDMWGNLGRITAEYPHLEHICTYNIEPEGLEHLQDVRDGTESCILISAHMGNWETNCPAALLQIDVPLHVTFRAPNNPWAAKLIVKIRSMGGRLKCHPKSHRGGRALMKAAKSKQNLAILIDQKYNEGVNVPFFGLDAMTNPIFVQLAQKYGHKIFFVQNIRLEGPRFKLIVNPALELYAEDGSPLPVEDVIGETHRLLERSIQEYPGQWLWLHRRWKD